MMAPIFALTLLAGVAAYGLASHFSNMVFDEWLYDSAISLANRVHAVDGRTTVDLPRGAREILEWDLVDRVFYDVTTGSEHIASNALLPEPSPESFHAKTHLFYEGNVQNAAVRILAVRVSIPDHNEAVVKVAETRNKHNALARQMLWISVGLTLIIAAFSTALAWYGISSGLGSMEHAVRAAGLQQAETPLRPIVVGDDMPSEMYPLVEEINRLIVDLAAAHRLNQRFTADAAHQLRTPLATLRVQLDTARREREPERHAKALEEAVGALTRMSHLLHQLLTLAKADHADTESRVPVDLGLIARQEVERHFDDARLRGIDLGYEGIPQRLTIQGRAELLREAVSNLIENALQYGGAGQKVTVGVIEMPPEIYVEDLGPGIPSEELPKVRDRFYRIPGSSGNGCGLGLSIVEEIARRSSAALVLEAGATGIGVRARLIFMALGLAGEYKQ